MQIICLYLLCLLSLCSSIQGSRSRPPTSWKFHFLGAFFQGKFFHERIYFYQTDFSFLGADHLDMPPPFVGAAPEDPVQSPDSRPLRDRMLKAPHREEQVSQFAPYQITLPTGTHWVRNSNASDQYLTFDWLSTAQVPWPQRFSK